MAQPEPFGKFILTGKVAVGGMAEIWKGRYADPSMPQFDIAVKRILPSYTEDESFVTMFKDEGTIALRLKHPNIVEIYEVGEVNGDWYIAMEFIHGNDVRVLADAAEKYHKHFTMTQIARIISDTAKGLYYAHVSTDEQGNPQNIVHRDCTPHNMMITFDGAIKLMDFGIAKAASRATKTRVGTVKGKSAYMSPEQAHGKQLDGRSDMFTLGTVGWELLTNYRLFKANSDMEAIRKILKSETIHPSDIDSNVPRELGDIILKTLEKNRDMRYAHCGELADALDNWINCYGDGSDKQLGVVVQALLGKNGHNVNELPNYTPGAALFVPDDQGNFVMKSEAPAPAAAAPVPNPYAQQVQQQQQQQSAPMLGAVAQPLAGGYDPNNASAIPRKKPVGLIIASVIMFILAGVFFALGASFFSKTAGEAPAYEVPESRFTLQTTPAGASIIINGEKIDAKTPHAYKAKLGENLKIEFNLDGYEPVVEERAARLLSQSLSVDLLTVEQARAAKATSIPEFVIKTSPDGANVLVNGEDKGTSPVTLHDVKFGEEIKIEISADGYTTKSTVFVATKGGEAETTVALAKATADNGKGAAAKVVVTKEKPAPAKDKGKTKDAGGQGTISVKATPWAFVSVDGARIGNTPVTKRALKAGAHKLELNYPAKQKKVSKSINVKANSHQDFAYDFNSEKWQ